MRPSASWTRRRISSSPISMSCPSSERVRGVAGGQFEYRGHLALRLAVAHERAVAARAERQRQRIEKNGFSRPGLAGEDRQPRREFEIQLIDQHHIANGEAREHQCSPIRTGTTVRQIFDIHEPPISCGDSPLPFNRL